MIERNIMEALHRAQTRKDPKAIAQAEALASVLKAVKLDGFQDVPLTQAEVVGELKRFSTEEKKALAKEGLKVIYPLTGESIDDQKRAGRKFAYIAPSDENRLMVMRSRLSEVAIDPRPEKFFLPKSNNNATLAQQLEMIAEYSYNLQRRLKTQTVEAIMGEAPDYTQLAFLHFDATGVRLFGKDYGFNYTRTVTPTVGTSVADVGGFFAGNGPNVDHWNRDRGSDYVFVAPLVVPKS